MGSVDGMAGQGSLVEACALLRNASGDCHWRSVACCRQRSAFFRPGKACGLWLRFVRERALVVWATSHSARTNAQSAGSSSDWKKSSRASRRLAQLASDAFSAGRPKRSQLLRRRTFRAGSDVEEQGPVVQDGLQDGTLRVLQSKLEVMRAPEWLWSSQEEPTDKKKDLPCCFG